MRQTNRVAQVLTTVFILQSLLLLGIQALYGTWPPRFSSLFFLGLDFRYFYDAARHWLAHANSYADANFTSPPGAMLVPLLFARLQFAAATRAMQFLNFALIAASVAALCRSLRLHAHECLSFVLIAATFSATHALVASGNMDALMLALLVLAYASRRQWLRAISLGASVAIKAYTGLLFLPLLRRKNYRILVIALIAAVVITLPFFPLIPDAFARLTHRTDVFRTSGNISPALLFLSALPSHPAFAKLAYLAFWLATLALALKNDRPRDSREWLITYIPWMLAAPALVLRYVAVLNLAVIARLVRISRERRLSPGEWTMVAGSILLGLYPAVFATVLPLSPETLHRLFPPLDAINALGVTVLILGAALGSKTWLQPLPEEVVELP